MNALSQGAIYESEVFPVAAPQFALPLDVTETYWGYIIGSSHPVATSVKVMQAGARFFGGGCVAAALALWLLPGSLFGPEVLVFKVVLTVITGLMAAILFNYAGKTGETELQVDTHLGELREVIRSKAGRTHLLGRYSFDCVGGVFIDRGDCQDDRGSLVLRYRNTSQVLIVAEGMLPRLELLRDRMVRDLILERARAKVLPQDRAVAV